MDLSVDSLELCSGKGLHSALQPCNLDAEPLPFGSDAFSGLACVGVRAPGHLALKHPQRALSRVLRRHALLSATPACGG